MLRNVKDLRGYGIRASDSVIGKVDDFYFDDETWAIRYLVVDTGTWLSEQESAHLAHRPRSRGLDGQAAACRPDESTGERSLTSTPKTGFTATRSRCTSVRRLSLLLGRRRAVGHGHVPGSLTTEDRIEEQLKAHGTGPTSTPNDCHLRSSNAVIGHHIGATDGEIGHLEDLLIDDHTWAIRYLIVNTSNWWSGHRVLVSPDCIRDVSWSEAKVSVGLTRQAVSDSPLYESTAQLESTRDPGAPSGPAPEMRAGER